MSVLYTACISSRVRNVPLFFLGSTRCLNRVTELNHCDFNYGTNNMEQSL
jgi:hypothetical protein